ncbi:hypothetical protein M378DRAFT_162681 [Amanita muscaria Koide BX008]|uniref:F-box domain-containing protein n=1 Tax=Amanita muscaria (strain Koide BX008) TaxID=946122 RepID=A0A0C2WSY8_AMAMK|nr:hypothetical protein M378DRAFT_162681 [Amanita muscaria Koide BX008]
MTNVIANRIPRDIIREILSHFKSALLTYRLGKFPWYLGHICAAWRAEFLPLCDTISIELALLEPTTSSTGLGFSPLPSNYERMLNVLRWYLDQNSDIPFSFTFCMAYSYIPAQSAYARRALVMLCEQSMRWLDAGLCIWEEEIDVLSQVKNRIPLLQGLVLDVGSASFQMDSDTFNNAPALSTLNLHIRAPWNFPWTSLTSLSFDVTEEDFKTRFDVLSKTVNLKELFIYGMYFAEHIGYDKQVMLPCLMRLFISGIAALEILRAPALVRLSIDAPNIESFSTVVESFFHASGCKLQQLETRLDSTSNFMELVERTPDLKHLHIADIVDIFAVLQNLTEDNSRATPLSHLQSLRLDHPMYSDKLHRQLCAFAKSRSRRVEFDGEMFVERLRTLVILQPDKQVHQRYGTELEKVCEECGVRLRYFESRYDIPDRWW